MKKLVLKTIARTLFYEFFILVIGLSIGFMLNSEYWGMKAPVIHRSIGNIFFHPEFDDVENNLINMGKLRLWAYLDFPNTLEITDERMFGEETFRCNYTYKKNNQDITGSYETHIHWKSWEAHYELGEPIK